MFNAQASCRRRAGIVALGVMVLSLPMRRRLCCRCDGVVALVAKSSLPSPMRRRLVIVDDDGNGETGDDDDDNQDGAKDDKVDDDDGNGAMMSSTRIK